MRFQVPKIVRPLTLTDYAPEMVKPGTAEPLIVWVWVNPPVALLDAYDEALERGRELAAKLEKAAGDDEIRALAQELSANGRRFAEWFAEIWSQGKDENTRWTAQDVLDMGSSETDPGLHSWLSARTRELIRAHREGQQKK